MKKLLLSFITATLLSSMSAGSAGAQELPEQKETLATIVKVNDYFMKKYADYTLPSFFGRVRPSNIWTRGVYYEGLIALYSIYPREDYYSYTYDCGNEPVGRIDPDGNDWRVQTHYNRETDKIEYKITVRAALINNSNNKELDIKTLAGQIVEQVNAAYTISGDDFVSTMDMQLRTVNSVDDIKDTEHVLQIVDQDMLTKTDKSVVMAETYKNSLDVKIGTKAVSNMLNNDDNRTFAHELGHSGGLGHTMNVENLMTQKKVIQDFDGDYLKATQLNRSQIQTVRDNYIHNKLNRHIPNWRQKLKRRQ